MARLFTFLKGFPEPQLDVIRRALFHVQRAGLLQFGVVTGKTCENQALSRSRNSRNAGHLNESSTFARGGKRWMMVET